MSAATLKRRVDRLAGRIGTGDPGSCPDRFTTACLEYLDGEPMPTEAEQAEALANGGRCPTCGGQHLLILCVEVVEPGHDLTGDPCEQEDSEP